MGRAKWAARGFVAALGWVLFAAGVSCGSPEATNATADPNGTPFGADATAEAAPSDGADAARATDAAASTQVAEGSAGAAGDAAVPGDDADVGEDAAADAASTACTPATGCPPSARCGRYVDPCSGKVFACGTPCGGANLCVASPGDPATLTCQPKACNGRCGVIGVDSCGVAIGCGGCTGGLSCVNNQCTPAVAANDAGACAALSCTPDPQQHLCGTITNGCGSTLSCACPSGQTCVAGVCGATPPECTSGSIGALCGAVTNACGSGSVACGGCATGSHCTNGACATCPPLSCGTATCGQVSNTCGQSETCGVSCPTNELCDNGACCAPQSCAAAEDAGAVTGCAPVDLGCGEKKSCAPCASGQVCTNNACVACVPKTCADFGNGGCGHADGCGKTLNCCAAGTTCESTICCPEGQVDYNGSCCLPACDPTQSSGPQTSCGQVIVCSG